MICSTCTVERALTFIGGDSVEERQEPNLVSGIYAFAPSFCVSLHFLLIELLLLDILTCVISGSRSSIDFLNQRGIDTLIMPAAKLY